MGQLAIEPSEDSVFGPKCYRFWPKCIPIGILLVVPSIRLNIMSR